MSPPLTVDEALERILDGVEPMPVERVSIEAAHRRTLAEPLAALITQPPFDASAMDGYAVRAADVARLPATLAVVGAAAAGHPFAGSVAAGEAVRISTGAPRPAGADAVVIQENTVTEPTGGGAAVMVRDGVPDLGNLRRTGFDFRAGEVLLGPGRRLGPRELSLAAAMGHGSLPVRRQQRVAIISTGDELLLPGSRPEVRSFPPITSAAPPWRKPLAREPSSLASRATPAKACRSILHEQTVPRSSSPLAAPRSAITTSSDPCSGPVAWCWRSGRLPCDRANRSCSAGSGPPVYWACPAIPSPPSCARAGSCCPSCARWR